MDKFEIPAVEEAINELKLTEFSTTLDKDIIEKSNIDLGLNDLPELPPDAPDNEHFGQACEMHNRACLAHICGGYDQAYKIMLAVMKRLERVVERNKALLEGDFFKDIFPTMVNLFVGVAVQYQKVNHITSANKLFQDNDVPGAIEQWTKALAVGGPQLNHVLFGNRGQAYMLQGEWELALRDAIKWARIRKHFTPPLVIKGQSLLQLQLFSEAVAAFKKAQALTPDDEELVKNYLQPAEELAAQKKELLLEMAEQDDDMSSAEDYLEDALVALKKKLWVDALLLLNDALDVNPALHKAQYCRAKCYFNLDMLEEALVDCKAVTEATPDNAKAHFLLGKICRGLLMPEQAFDAFGRAMELSPDTAKYLKEAEDSAAQYTEHQEREDKLKKERDEYHATLTKDWPVVIKETEDRGRAMFSAKDLKKGDVVFEETPIVSFQMQTSQNRVMACNKCLKPLKFTESGLKSVALDLVEEMKSNPAVSEQFGGVTFDNAEELAATMKEVGLDQAKEPVPCEFCKSTYYCSEECRQTAFTETHQRLCLGPNPPEGHPMKDLIATMNESDLPITQMFPRLLARMIQYQNVEGKENKSELLAKNLFQHMSADENDKPDDKLKEQNEVIALCKDAIYDERLPYAYMPNFFWRMASLRARNSTQIKIVDSQIPGLEVEGAALCAGISAINHSCTPNCHYTSRSVDHKHTLIADEDIPKDIELTISYVSQKLSLEDRQLILEHTYGFKCGCPKCKAEKK
eukprot:CAMPEP_0177681574 /NCGR_PEP_ID=MMETSP0447-20121125/30796_1 /TAXON_ID=0 /ORGANISM="Stygamoeba regulata, Strain BSH-02190019" /LENGTH=746 /DNA_ID=CAMNT_0019191015 /DNA_START=128 /DNA_END=2368 /DNA_ORIENTATION=-